MDDIRWTQRFQNFDRAFLLLNSAVNEVADLSELEQEGLIQRFEYTFELAWKTLKDYLTDNGIEIAEVTARNVIKESFSAGILPNAEIFIAMMRARNQLAHGYDFTFFKQAIIEIREHYLTALAQLHKFFTQKLAEINQ